MRLKAVLIPAIEGGFIAKNPETGTCTQGETHVEALSNLKEATELYLEVCCNINKSVSFSQVIIHKYPFKEHSYL